MLPAGATKLSSTTKPSSPAAETLLALTKVDNDAGGRAAALLVAAVPKGSSGRRELLATSAIAADPLIRGSFCTLWRLANCGGHGRLFRSFGFLALLLSAEKRVRLVSTGAGGFTLISGSGLETS